MIARLIVHIRYLRAWWDHISAEHRRAQRESVEPDPLTLVSSLDPIFVGRQAVEGDAILDIAAWLAANGFADMGVGERQRYACYLRRARADYEAGRYARV